MLARETQRPSSRSIATLRPHVAGAAGLLVRWHEATCHIFFCYIFLFCSYVLKVVDMSSEPSPLHQFAGLLWAVALTMALAVLCRFLPGDARE